MVQEAFWTNEGDSWRKCGKGREGGNTVLENTLLVLWLLGHSSATSCTGCVLGLWLPGEVPLAHNEQQALNTASATSYIAISYLARWQSRATWTFMGWRPSEFSNIRLLGKWLWIRSTGEHHVLVSLWLHTLSLCAQTLFPPIVPFFSLILGYIENVFSSNYHAYSFCFPPHLPMALSSANYSLIS